MKNLKNCTTLNYKAVKNFFCFFNFFPPKKNTRKISCGKPVILYKCELL